MTLLLRRATLADLDAIERLEREIFTLAWSRESLRAELEGRPGRVALLAEFDGRPAGFAFGWRVADELHVVTVAVAESVRRRGVGRSLLRGLFDAPESLGASLATLEVRTGNEPAKALYREFGFADVAIRPRYYPDTQEDALILVRAIPPTEAD